MRLELNLQQKMSQQLVVTLQLQQAIQPIQFQLVLQL